MQTLDLLSKSVAETKAYATQVAEVVQPGDIVLLNGTLGSGKTQFVKCFCEALGYTDLVTSPSYTLVNLYEMSRFNIVHVDFYRMDTERELLDIDLDSYLDESVILIEWGNKFPETFADFLNIDFEHTTISQTVRKLVLSYQGDKWNNKFKKIEHTLSIKS